MNIDFARKLELAYHQQCKDRCSEFPLKQTGFDILMFLGNNPQYKHAKDIVEIRKIKANLVSIHVDQLVDQGYLSRIDVPGDRRKVELVLNKKANDVIKKGKAFQNHFFSSLFSDIDEKHQKIFKETLELISDGCSFSGNYAWKHGLIDQIGGIEQALEFIRTQLGEASIEYEYYPENKIPLLYKKIFRIGSK